MVELAAVKRPAAAYAKRAGHWGPPGVVTCMGFAPVMWSEIKNPSSPARASAGSLFKVRLFSLTRSYAYADLVTGAIQLHSPDAQVWSGCYGENSAFRDTTSPFPG
jgi:hypothetical protein